MHPNLRRRNGSTWVLLIPALFAVAVPVGIALRAPRPGHAPLASSLRRPTDSPPVAAPEDARPAPPAAAPETVTRPGWLRVALELPPEAKDATVHAVVYAADRTVEQSEQFIGVDRFLLGPLKPGAKALFLYSTGGQFGALSAEAVVSEGEEVDVNLRAPALVRLDGVVVDAAGRPLPKAEVQIQEFFPWKQAGPDSAGPFRGGGGATLTSHGRGSSYSYFSSAQGIRFSTGSICDKEGRFSLRIGSGTAPVTVRILRDYKPVLETAVVPGAAPLRLVAPEPSK